MELRELIPSESYVGEYLVAPVGDVRQHQSGIGGRFIAGSALSRELVNDVVLACREYHRSLLEDLGLVLLQPVYLRQGLVCADLSVSVAHERSLRDHGLEFSAFLYCSHVLPDIGIVEAVSVLVYTEAVRICPVKTNREHVVRIHAL